MDLGYLHPAELRRGTLSILGSLAGGEGNSGQELPRPPAPQQVFSNASRTRVPWQAKPSPCSHPETPGPPESCPGKQALRQHPSVAAIRGGKGRKLLSLALGWHVPVNTLPIRKAVQKSRLRLPPIPPLTFAPLPASPSTDRGEDWGPQGKAHPARLARPEPGTFEPAALFLQVSFRGIKPRLEPSAGFLPGPSGLH